MEEKEVIRMLKEHILHCIQDHGKLTKFDRGYCLRYIRILFSMIVQIQKK